LQIAVFDLDRTLIKSNSSFQFCLYLYKHKVLSLFYVIKSCVYYIQHRFLGLSLTQLHEKTFKTLLKGMSLSVIASHVKSFVDGWLSEALYYPAFSELRRAQHLGFYTMILSNSPGFLVKVIAERLNVSEWKATEYEVDKDGRLCHIAHVLNGRDKASQVRKIIRKLGLTKRNVVAYSDSVWDLPFLESAGQAVVVNPDRKLQKISQEHNWPKI